MFELQPKETNGGGGGRGGISDFQLVETAESRQRVAKLESSS